MRKEYISAAINNEIWARTGKELLGLEQWGGMESIVQHNEEERREACEYFNDASLQISSVIKATKAN